MIYQCGPLKERQSLYCTENEGKMGFVFLPINIYDSSASQDRKCVSASVQWCNTHSKQYVTGTMSILRLIYGHADTLIVYRKSGVFVRTADADMCYCSSPLYSWVSTLKFLIQRRSCKIDFSTFFDFNPPPVSCVRNGGERKLHPFSKHAKTWPLLLYFKMLHVLNRLHRLPLTLLLK